MNNKLILSSLMFIGLSACKAPAEKNDSEQATENQELKELQIKLNATEAQLLNVRAELAKCKGDSIPENQVDSL